MPEQNEDKGRWIKILNIGYVNMVYDAWLNQNNVAFETSTNGNLLRVSTCGIVKNTDTGKVTFCSGNRIIELPSESAYYTNVLTTKTGVENKEHLVENAARLASVNFRNGLKYPNPVKYI